MAIVGEKNDNNCLLIKASNCLLVKFHGLAFSWIFCVAYSVVSEQPSNDSCHFQ